MAKIYVFLADGFEEIEGLTVVDLLRRAGEEVVTVSVMERKEIVGSHQICLLADALFEELDFADAGILVLPGGMPGTRHLGEYEPLTRLLADWNAKGGKIAAICAAPSVLGDLGLLKGRVAVCYPGFEKRLAGAQIGSRSVAVDGNITTSRGLGTAIDFSLALVEQLQGEGKAEEIRKSIIYREFS